MKHKPSLDLLIALAILLTCAGLLLALFLALRQPPTPSTAYYTDLPSANGLRIRSQVRYAGVPVGSILNIEPLDWNERPTPSLAVRIRFSLNRKIPQLKTDSYATITSDSPSQPPYLNLYPGSPNADPLPPDSPIPPPPTSLPSPSSPSALPTTSELSQLLELIRQDYPLFKDKLTTILTEIESTTAQIRSLANAASIPLTESSSLLEKQLSSLQLTTSILQKIDSIVQNLEPLPAQLSSLTSTLHNSSLTLHHLLSSANATAAKSSPTLHASLSDLRQALLDLRSTAALLRSHTEALPSPTPHPRPHLHLWPPRLLHPKPSPTPKNLPPQ